MQILAAADLHGNHDVYEWLVTAAAERRPDVVVTSIARSDARAGISTSRRRARSAR